MLMLQLYSNNIGGASLKLLANSLSEVMGYKVLRTTKKNDKIQLRYGFGVDKYSQYNYFKAQGLSALEFTESSVEAIKWIQEEGTVFGRKLLWSSCGKGIVVMEKEEDHVYCPVYTKYKKKKREFRVHIFKDTVVTVTEKRRKTGWIETRNTQIRNLANGYVFCHEIVDEPEGLRELALKAAKVTISDFKGVDIGYNKKDNCLFVIEVNSAPGIQGKNVQLYTDTIISCLNLKP